MLAFSYTAPDGQQIRVTYIADENGMVESSSFLRNHSEFYELLKIILLSFCAGFQPQGSHLPQLAAPVAAAAPLAPRPINRGNQGLRRQG